jgi:hypothetical protein
MSVTGCDRLKTARNNGELFHASGTGCNSLQQNSPAKALERQQTTGSGT